MFPNGAILFGEGYGAKIQKVGSFYRSDQSFVLFDVIVRSVTDTGTKDYWLRRDNVDDIGDKLDIDTVPVIGIGTLYDACNLAREGIKSQWGDFEAEGIVARPVVELFDRKGNRLITKIKTRDFAKR